MCGIEDIDDVHSFIVTKSQPEGQGRSTLAITRVYWARRTHDLQRTRDRNSLSRQVLGLLGHASVGRIAIDIAGKPDIFPINYVVNNQSIVFRSGPGTKLAGAVLLHHVAFEIDGYEPSDRTAWGDVIKGKAHQIERMDDVFAAKDLPLFPWVAFPKPDFVRITAIEVTGRRFTVIDTAAPDASIGWKLDQSEATAVLSPPEAK
jgi:nitroimidazol reductase NimA-like FMN-containing flavoprotein (pyridoxamine 5'-phosphate oxidase superfamily)